MMLGNNETHGYVVLLRELAENQSRLESKLKEYFEYRLHKSLLLYVPIVIYTVGIVGNSLSFVVLVRKRMRRVSTYAYLAVLSLADTLVLTVGLLALWVGELTGSDVRGRHPWSCKILNVLGYTASDFSVWLIIAVTVERFIAVCHPLRAAAMCTHRTARRVVAGVFGLVLGFNLNFVWTTELRPFAVDVDYSVVYECSAREGYERFVNRVWPWIDAVLYSALPFVIILLLNALIIDRVVRARRRRQRGLASEAAAAAAAADRAGPHRSAITTKIHSSLATTTTSSSSSSSSSSTTKGDANTTLSLMLLTITFAFLVMTLPMNVMMIAAAFWHDVAGETFHQRAKYHLAKTVSELLMYVNHSMNFFLYCGTGQKFRQELCSLVCRRKRKTSKTVARSVSFNLVSRQSVVVYH